MRAANVLDPDVRPRATKEIGPMIAMIKTLIEQGHAYAADNGDVYFAVRSDPNYGQVSGRNIDDLMVGARIEENEDKNDPLDFALWKAAKPGEPSWPSPWGEGRPGWHTECAAMVHRYLGTPIDIHGGGSDLAFPHHENECAQATCAWHQGFSNTWMHTGMLLVDGEKMSKSLGNFFTLAEVLEQHSAAALRLLAATDCPRRMAVLGDMGDLGDLSPKAHTDIGLLLNELKLDCVVAVGHWMTHLAHAAQGNVYHFDTLEQARDTLHKEFTPGTVALVKASHSMHFEKIVEELEKV